MTPATSTGPIPSRPLLDVYMRPGTLSLVAGSGESMHEVLLYQIARDIRRGSCLGYQSVQPVSVVIADLTSRYPGSSQRLLRQLDLDEAYFPIYNPPRKHGSHPIEHLFDTIAPFWPADGSHRLLVIRGLHALYPANPHIHSEASGLVSSLELQAEVHNCAILASCSVSKAAAQQEYRPRDRVFGSTAWSDHVEDIFVVDFPTITTTTDQRVLYLTKRGAATQRQNLQYTAGEGFTSSAAAQATSVQDKLTFLVSTMIPTGDSMSRRDIMRVIDPDFPVSESSWKRFFAYAVDVGLLAKDGHGAYVRPNLTVQ